MLRLKVSDDLRARIGGVRKGSMKFVTGRIHPKTQLIEVDETGESLAEDMKGLSEALPRDSARYVWMKFDYSTPDGPRSKTVLMSWIPSRAKVREKMICAAAMVGLRHTTGASVSLQANDAEDFSFEAVRARCSKFSH